MTDRFSKDEIERVAKWQFKGMRDAAELMAKEAPGRRLVGRWDWHLWMFLVTTCVPCFGMYCLVMWVRADMWKKHRELEAEKKNPPSEKLEPAPEDSISFLRQEMEKLKILLLMQGKQGPHLPPDSVRRLFSSGTEKTADLPEEKETPESAESVKALSFSQRMWRRVKPWLPFYVEPYFSSDGSPPIMQADFSALNKPRDGNP